MSTSQITTGRLRIGAIRPSHVSELIRLGEATDLSPWTASNYLEELQNPHAIMLRLADEDDNSTCGFIVGRLVTGSEIVTRPDAEIYNIAVRPDRQGNGHGQELFDEFAATCRERLVANIWLEVRESNHRAIRFYQKNGFNCVQSRPSFYENPRENALLMKLILAY
jgi:ribosomal-protein-alanine N-acetyltransferase